MTKDDILFCCGEIEVEIRRLYKGAPQRANDGRGIGHVLWMLDEMRTRPMSDRKIATWFGYVQCALIYNGFSTLDAERDRSRRFSANEAA